MDVVAWILGGYIALGLGLDAALGYFQPESDGRTAVLRTFDAEGTPTDTVLGLLDDNGQLWVESGHWFRGWYHRLQENPEVELVRNGETTLYRAVPDDSPEAVDTVTRLMGKGSGASYWVGRTVLLWAPIKPVRLEPRPAESSRSRDPPRRS